jgi:putative transcription factor
MCGGKEASARVNVEGVILSLCEGCSSYGKVVGRIAVVKIEKKKVEARVVDSGVAEGDKEVVVEDFGKLLKQKREGLGMKQKEFASKIAVKESILHKMETGSMIPSLEEAKRIGKQVGFKAIDIDEGSVEIIPQGKKEGMTLGDMIKIKKK